MSKELQASMPVMPLPSGYQIRFEAIDPDSGDPVAGVNVFQAKLYAINLLGFGTTDEQSGPFMFVPGPSRSA